MGYKRKLTANHYRGCSDNLARAIDRMAGLEPDTLTKQPTYQWRGSDRKINSYCDWLYKKQKEKENG